MADEITCSGNLSFSKSTASLTVRSNGSAITATGSKYIHNVQAIGFAAAEALALGDVGTCGYAMFHNLGPTNFVNIGTNADGIVTFLKLKAGEWAGPLRLGTDVPVAQADTGAINLEYCIVED